MVAKRENRRRSRGKKKWLSWRRRRKTRGRSLVGGTRRVEVEAEGGGDDAGMHAAAAEGMLLAMLHEDGVEPAFKFPTYRLEDARVSKAQGFMEANGGHIGAVADHRDHLTPPTLFTLFDQVG